MALTCYTRPECCLCEHAHHALDRLVARGLATVAYISVEGDEALEMAFGTRIPVVTMGDEVLAEGKVSEIWLARAIEARRGRRRASGAAPSR